MLRDIFKTDKWVNAGNGCINIHSDLDNKAISQILKEDNLFQIQFYNKPSIRTFDLLNEHLFSIRPDVFLRLTKYSDPLTDLGFLKSMDKLENLYIDIFDIQDFEVIGEIKNLKGLILSDTKAKGISLAPISILDKLTYLQISGIKKDIDKLTRLRNITELVLRSMTVDNLDFLKNFDKLEKFHVILGGTKNYEILKGLPLLKHLDLWQVRQLDNIEFISDLKELEYLRLASLRNIFRLPSFTNNTKLTKLIFDTLKGLNDISSLNNLKNLEELLFVAANNLTVEQFKILKDCPNLRMVTVGFGSAKKNKEFENYLNSIGIGQYDWRKSKFKY